MKKIDKDIIKTMATTLTITFILTAFVFFSYIAFYNTASTALGKDTTVFLITRTDSNSIKAQIGEKNYNIDISAINQVKDVLKKNPILILPPVKFAMQIIDKVEKN